MRRVLLWSGIGLSVLVLGLALTALVCRPEPGPLLLERRTVEVDGAQLSYHQRGNGPDVVLLHGGMGSAEDFMPVLDTIAREFRLTAIDRPGFGLSHASADHATYPGNARQIAGLIQAIALVRPIVVGHSHGGGVALQLAEEFPDLPGALVLLAPAWKPGASASLLDHALATPLIGEGIAASIGAMLAPGMIAGILERMIGPDAARVPPDFVSYRQQLWTNPHSLAVHSRQRVTDAAGLADIRAGLGKIRVRSLVLGCDGDSNEGETLDSRRLAMELPGAALWWLTGCGHYVQFGQPEKVVEAIRQMAGAQSASP